VIKQKIRPGIGIILLLQLIYYKLTDFLNSVLTVKETIVYGKPFKERINFPPKQEEQ
jgi:hypothetical protein